MAGVTSIANDHAPEDSNINLYFNLTNKQLALQQRSERNQNDTPMLIFTSTSSAQAGIIVSPSHIAAASFNSVPVVFGFTARTPGSTEAEIKHDVSIISPVYKPFSMTSKSNTTIAAASNDKVTSVFYLIGGEGNAVQIEQYNIGDSSKTVLEDATGIHNGTSLAAYWAEERDGPACRIIYQAKHDNALYDYKPEDGSKKIKHADARSGSALAVTVANKKAYLYYVSGYNKLMKIVKSDITNSGSWGDSNAIETNEIYADSQITVVAAGGKNHIFFASGDTGTDLEHVIDAW